jgi:hypothetical protein
MMTRKLSTARWKRCNLIHIPEKWPNKTSIQEITVIMRVRDK